MWILINLDVAFETTATTSIVVQTAEFIGPFESRELAEKWGDGQHYLVVKLINPE